MTVVVTREGALAASQAVAAVFGERAPQACRYAELLATRGIERGLIGPREADRIWDRHLFNSAALAGLVPPAAAVVDLGSGAGLPGIPLALARPDLTVTLLEPMARRVAFLRECLAELCLDRVSVHHGRAEDGVVLPPDVVVARAVAPLRHLAELALALGGPETVLLALKGRQAANEIAAATADGGYDAELATVEVAGETAAVAIVRRSAGSAPRRARDRRRSR